jgi:YfiH family protein
MGFYPPHHITVSQISVFHGFFGRLGGVSSGIHDSLNCSFKTDDAKNVLENRRRIVACYGQPLKNLMLLKQVHGGHAVVIDEVDNDIESDAMVTCKKNIVLGVQTADCLPILLYSEEGVAAAVHGGWKSLVGDIVDHTVKKMIKLGATRSKIIAAIGPCIHQSSYEVQQDFYDNLCKISPQNEIYFSSPIDGIYLFDLLGYAYSKLVKAEVESIIDTDQNTYTDPKTYFSRRYSLHQGNSRYGSQLSVIVLS